MKTMKENKFYCVYPDDIEVETKAFRYRKSADKYGAKLVEKYGHCTIVTYINGEKITSERY